MRFAGVLCALLLACASGLTKRQQALLFVDKGRWEEASQLLEEHLGSQPEDAKSRTLLLRIYASHGQKEKALRHFERLAELAPPNRAEVWIERGHLFELEHDYASALAAYDRASAVAPARAVGPKYGGRRALAWGQLEEAQERLREATRREPSDSEAWHLLGRVLLAQGKYSEAQGAYHSGIVARPESVANWIGLAAVAMASGDMERALQSYVDVTRRFPRYTPALLGKSYCLIALGRYSEAEHALAQAERAGASRASLRRQREWLRKERDAKRHVPVDGAAGAPP